MPSLHDQTLEGYQSPTNTQFSVFLDNRVGRLMELIRTFEGQPLQVVALSVIDATDHAVVRLVTTHADRARQLLKKADLPYSEADIIVVELTGDQTLLGMCTCLLVGEVNICYAYPLMVRPHGAPTIALHTDEQITAGMILKRKNFVLLGEADLTDTTGPDNPFDLPDN